MKDYDKRLSVCYACPDCGHVFGYKYYIDSGEEEKKEVCPECGQDIDWNECSDFENFDGRR